MPHILDLHIHSRYSRACSPQLSLANIAATSLLKGVDIIATGDFTYPDWFKAINSELEETTSGSGLYKLKTAPDDKVKFILGTELSLVYKDGGRVRRIHLVIHAPHLAAVKELNAFLDKKYNIRSDGRPILGLSAPDLVKLLLKINPLFLVYPAHIWTPWYSVFGSKSGFDSLAECFHDQTEHIYAYETGLSSDPAMNWRLSALDNLSLLSSSDAHSLNNIAREATVMELGAKVSYEQIYLNIKHRKNIIKTLEFYPEEGMYHLDGHRACQFYSEPEQSRRLNNICPVCKKPLIIGVLNRVEELADRPDGFRPPLAPDFEKMVELDKIIGEAWGIKGRQAKAVQTEYRRLIKELGSELFILLDLDLSGQAALTHMDERIREGIGRVRRGELDIKPGFDGQYGQINIFDSQPFLTQQKSLL